MVLPTSRSRTWSPDRPIRVVLADDECLFRASIRHLLAIPPPAVKQVYGVDIGAGLEVVGEAACGQEAVDIVRSVRPDLLLLDLWMPRMSGLDTLRELAADMAAEMRTIILTGAIEPPQLLTAVHRGARGVLLKDVTAELMFEAIASVMAGQCWLGQIHVTSLFETIRPLLAPAGRVPLELTPREQHVLQMVAAGMSNREIAARCMVSEQTVKHHLTRMFDKVGASNRLELALQAARHGLAAPSIPS